MTDAVKSRIRAYLKKQVLKVPVEDHESFWETGAIDSLGILQVVLFLESEFGIKVPGKEINSKSFESIDAVAAYVVKRAAPKRSGRGAA